MKQIALLSFVLLSLLGCKGDDALEAEISKLEVNLTIERFDRAFANAKATDLHNLKSTFPFLFSKRTPDSVWIRRMSDTIQNELHSATDKQFGNFKTETNGFYQIRKTLGQMPLRINNICLMLCNPVCAVTLCCRNFLS